MNRKIALLAASLTLAGTLLATPALAGPPLLCFPYEIGKSKSLPWGKDAFSQSKGYDTSKVVDDTLGLLKTEKSALVRMETLRRAAIYVQGNKPRATELLAKLAWIALDAEAAGTPSADAWFNAGYLAATFEQGGVDLDWKPGVADGRNGYAWIKQALALTPDDPAMHFAAALVCSNTRSGAGREHIKKAVAGTEPGTDLAKSIESNLAMGQKSLQTLRKELGVTDGKSSASSGR